ncbi:MAG: hypothetical protein FWD40_12030 [Treponema sp.]|nr:hypothetical protein [Treponema sp.]
MKLISFLKPGLFIYELIRILIFVFILIIQKNDHGSAKIIFASSSALFTLMALFIWIDIDRYKTYLPLYIAGKCICVFLEAVFSIASRQVTMIGGRDAIAFLSQLVLSGDLFALGIVFLILRDVQKSAEAGSLKDGICCSHYELHPEDGELNPKAIEDTEPVVEEN